jgi:hypothetical protein
VDRRRVQIAIRIAQLEGGAEAPAAQSRYHGSWPRAF